MDFEQKFEKNSKPEKTHIQDHYVLPIRNMGVMGKKYGVSVSFSSKLTIFSKTVGSHLCILSENLIFFKTHKNSYTRPLYITDLEYGDHGRKI
jgi:hypothetical protein